MARSLYTDPQRLQQVLKNLLANAFKFTADGSVTLRIHRPEPDTHFSNPSLAFERVVAFSVVDTGIGIPENKQGLIFEAFQQADGTTSRRYGGTGLGLTISRDIARHLGGEIHVESRPGQGSVFTLYLPERYIGLPAPDEERGAGRRELERSATPPSVPQFAALEPSVLAAIAGRRVLVVDDDVRNVFAMTSALEAAGLEVVYADNGQAGIDTLAADPEIDLVLMDVMMPGKDGYETIRTIRANPDWHEMPIVAVTAKALEDDRDKCLEAGASDYLPKPVDVNRLLNLIRHLAAAPEGPEAS